MKASKKKGRLYRGIKEGVILEQLESTDDEAADNLEEAMNTWELGTLLGLITPSTSEVIESLSTIIRSAMITAKSRGQS